MNSIIYVYLLDEGTDCWRPVQAVKRSDDVYKIVEENDSDGDETWQFSTGDFVRCELREFASEKVLVAVEKVDSDDHSVGAE